MLLKLFRRIDVGTNPDVEIGRFLTSKRFEGSPKVAEVLPVLYLRGLSTGDFREALPILLGEDAAGLSPTNIARLTAVWEQEYQAFRQRALGERDYVYVWVDGVHFTIRLEDERLCTLVMLGVRPTSAYWVRSMSTPLTRWMNCLSSNRKL